MSKLINKAKQKNHKEIIRHIINLVKISDKEKS